MLLEEVFRPIEEFPDYDITNFGRVFNGHSGREMVLSPTLSGDLTVGLMKFGRQYRRSVKVLVARAFVEGEDAIANTPIQLDGNRENLRADNIVWRPRWLAWEYSRQFTNPPEWVNDGPVAEQYSGKLYHSIFDAAIATGQLYRDIRRSMYNGRPVFPTGEIYSLIE